MADIICRWRNGTPQTVVELGNALPHEKMPIDEFRSIMEKRWEGFFRTAYQLACQLALYCESEDGYYYPRFDHNITESEARSWLLNWLPKYYVPNPFTKKDGFNDIECPTFVLKALYDYVREHGVCSYALAFKNVFHEETRNNDDIIKNYINNYSRVLSFSKYGNLEIVGSYEEVFGDMNRNDKKGFFDSFDEKKDTTVSNLSSFTPTQIIYYGVPGCGKSYEVNKVINDELDKYGVTDKEYHKVRCVFHPEYCNADFVGQIYPKIEEKTNADGSTSSVVVYEFKPGPFAEIVRRAYQNPDEPFFLIIEEINRGNAAAIFGESFQLLDRIKVGEPADDSTENVYGEGWSAYGIDNQDVNAYIRDQQRKNADKQKGHCSCVKGGCSDVEQESKLRSYPFVDISSEKLNTTWVHKDGGAEKREEKTLHFSANTAIRLPPNLSIYATMNTSDQNVITMDNAFQRRFKSRMIRNDLKNAAQYNIKIEGTNVCWGAFRDWVNGKILSTPSISKADDKCLGGWFISTSVETKDDDGNVTKFKDISRADFAEKVIKYLWDDVFKRNATTVIFKKGPGNGEFKSLSELIDAFENETGQLSESFDKVFKLSEADKRNLIKDMNGVSQQAGLADEESVEGESVTDA